MRIGILGDTHGDASAIRRTVATIGVVDLWLHTGDYSRDAMLVSALSGSPVTAVRGNCDGQAKAKPDEFIEICGYRLWLTHGHRHDVKYGLGDLENWARRYEADVVIFGHTHQPCCETLAGLLLFNPGSAAEPRRGQPPTCGVLELTAGRGGILPSVVSLY